MIVKKHFLLKIRYNKTIEVEGWYLFGIIPFYIHKTYLGEGW